MVLRCALFVQIRKSGIKIWIVDCLTRRKKKKKSEEIQMELIINFMMIDMK